MKIAKQIIRVVWPVIYSKLSELAQKTETPFDDIGLASVNTFFLEWLNSEKDE